MCKVRSPSCTISSLHTVRACLTCHCKVCGDPLRTYNYIMLKKREGHFVTCWQASKVNWPAAAAAASTSAAGSSVLGVPAGKLDLPDLQSKGCRPGDEADSDMCNCCWAACRWHFEWWRPLAVIAEPCWCWQTSPVVPTLCQLCAFFAVIRIIQQKRSDLIIFLLWHQTALLITSLFFEQPVQQWRVNIRLVWYVKHANRLQVEVIAGLKEVVLRLQWRYSGFSCCLHWIRNSCVILALEFGIPVKFTGIRNSSSVLTGIRHSSQEPLEFRIPVIKHWNPGFQWILILCTTAVWSLMFCDGQDVCQATNCRSLAWITYVASHLPISSHMPCLLEARILHDLLAFDSVHIIIAECEGIKRGQWIVCRHRFVRTYT